ncbi:hypothetical protein BD289DRAFT_206175 [Coniella lustricola]|uniref:3'-5' exonuclease domain-containing protein n=1 Tax=Coniella lustricola TaxID=2025994 RepID=A0A2T3AC32_9PEZI|nr:hypothetical protein BD289DRAFT_206175 [Coniella lustricola]
MTAGQHGAGLLSSGTGKAHVIMSLGHSCLPGLAPVALGRTVTRRSLFSANPSRSIRAMSTGDVSNHPPKWNLWHPTRGIVFQQPLYPTLKVAGYSTNASLATASQDEELSNVPIQWDQDAEQVEESAAAEEDCGDDTLPILSEAQPGGNAIGPDEGILRAPHTTLDFKVPDELFQAAKQAPEGTRESYWSHLLYRGPDLDNDRKGKIRVHYCKNAASGEQALQTLLGEKLIGLDLEWETKSFKNAGVRKNVSLVQLASPSRVVLLHLAMYPKDEFVTPTLRKIIEDPDVLKLGVCIKGDCTRLRNYLDIDARGVFELSHLFKQVRYSATQPHLVDKRPINLATVCKEVLGLPMCKDAEVRMSSWAQTLDLEQINYSVSDAYSAVQIFSTLDYQREQMDPKPDLPFPVEANKLIPLPEGVEYKTTKKSSLARSSTSKSPMGEASPESTCHRGTEIDASAKSDLDQETWTEGEEGLRNIFGLLGLNYVEESEETSTSNATRSRTSLAADKTATGAEATSSESTTSKDFRVMAAEACLTAYQTTKEANGGKMSAGPAAMRAYFIWQADPSLTFSDVAGLLRDPPLKTSTVASYIVSSVEAEVLPYDENRLTAEISDCVASQVMGKRYYTKWRALSQRTLSQKRALVKD